MSSFTRISGPPTLALSAFDLGAQGYAVDEFLLGGDASAYRLDGPFTPDGLWNAVPTERAPFTTRMVVVRPIEAETFNGTVVVEWLNVSAGFDAAPDWGMAHRELMRGGFAWVGVSAQKVGIEGGPSLAGPAQPLKQVNPERYKGLSHPGDAFAYDIFAQAGRAVRTGAAEILSGLVPKRLIAAGESQSAIFMTTYVNAVEPLAKVFEGFLVHSRYGASASLEGGQAVGVDPLSLPQNVRFRMDRRAPVLVVITETDLVFGRLGGYWSARQPDDPKLRVWEIAGTAHADNYALKVAMIDSGEAAVEQLAAAWAPTSDLMGLTLDKPINFGPQHHYVVQAAFASLERWLRTGEPPPVAEPLVLTRNNPPGLQLDALGVAQGGIRSPWVDAPVARLSGVNTDNSIIAKLFGEGEAFDRATLDRLYPGGKRDYLRRFEASLDAAIGAGFILAEDRREILDLAAFGYVGSP